jgi:hypothetical protein
MFQGLLRLAALAAVLASGFVVGTAPAPSVHRIVCHGKPAPAIGEVSARLVERIDPDRAVVEATWTRGPAGTDRHLSFLLPEGALLIEGSEETALPDDQDGDTVRWLVQFLVGEPLDVVVRISATTPDGPVSRETAVRVTE